jgi:hypothetical protein
MSPMVFRILDFCVGFDGFLGIGTFFEGWLFGVFFEGGLFEGFCEGLIGLKLEGSTEVISLKIIKKFQSLFYLDFFVYKKIIN